MNWNTHTHTRTCRLCFVHAGLAPYSTHAELNLGLPYSLSKCSLMPSHSLLPSLLFAFIAYTSCKSSHFTIGRHYHQINRGTETLITLSQADAPPLSPLTYLDNTCLFELLQRTPCPQCVLSLCSHMFVTLTKTETASIDIDVTSCPEFWDRVGESTGS